MSKQLNSIEIKVTCVEVMTPFVKRFTFARADGGRLPPFTAGSHVIVSMRDGHREYHNAYSLMGSPRDTRSYQIAVRKEDASRGGSLFMHERVVSGAILSISEPANLFPLAGQGGQHVFVAGGIGITPFLSYLHELADRDCAYELHYAYREAQQGAFVEMLQSGPHRDRVRLYAGSLGQRMDATELFATLKRDAHVYVCGPQKLNDSVLTAGRLAGWANEQLHSEQFAASSTSGRMFAVVLARSGREVMVAEDETILQALHRCGVRDVPSLCREGVCGTCEVAIVEGEADHRDQYLMPDEKAAQKTMMICVSRAATPRLVLDL